LRWSGAGPNWQPKRFPARHLFPAVSPETFVTATPFPPDDRSMGYERGTSVSKAWAEATTQAALETADYVARHLRDLSGAADDAPDREAKVRAFCRRFTERAFRRPLPDEVARVFVEQQFRTAPDLETAVKRVVLLALKSPRFLYREIVPEAPVRPRPTRTPSPRAYRSRCGTRSPMRNCYRPLRRANCKRARRWPARPSA
jgi:hypothetical protein